jgi:SNF2 family DNA or RNA helicase
LPLTPDEAPANKPKPEPIKKIPTKIRQDIQFLDHQVEGIRALNKIKSWILADQMGLGKTLQSLSVAAIDFDKGLAHRILVVAGTKQLKYQWGDELEKLTNFTYHILDGTPTQRRKQLDRFISGDLQDRDILIVNYEQISKHIASLNAAGFEICIVDECHEVKNPDAIKTKAIHQLEMDRWFLLSGTPVLNRPDELWSPLKLIDPEGTPAYDTWVNRHCLFDAKTGKVVGVKKKEALRQYMGTIMLRRLKKDCLDLPDKQYVRINVELTPRQREAYDAALQEIQREAPVNPTHKQRFALLSKSLKLRQICSTMATLGEEDDSAKLDALVDDIKALVKDEQKTVVFTQWLATLGSIQERLHRAGITFWAISGEVQGLARNDRVKAWTATEEPAVLVCMYQVAAVGLNLTAASTALMADKLYVPGKLEQAEDRLHRIGQEHPVTIREYISRRTIEEKIERILANKGEMIDTLLPNSGWDEKLYELILERN